MTGRTEYWRADSTGTLHARADCHSARRSTLRPLLLDLTPDQLWEVCWSNRSASLGVHPAGVTERVEVIDGDGGSYGVTKWACLHCVEQAAIDLGWVNTHPPDPERRHR